MKGKDHRTGCVPLSPDAQLTLLKTHKSVI